MIATQKMFCNTNEEKKARFHVKSNQLTFIIHHCAYFEKKKEKLY